MKNEKRLIDANALRTDTMAMCGVNEAVLENCYPYWQFNKAIVNAPTVDAVEVVHGRWVHDCVEGCNPFVDSLPVWVDVMQCSVCKEYIEGSHGTKYCPNCGAKMDNRKDNLEWKYTPKTAEIDFDYEAED